MKPIKTIFVGTSVEGLSTLKALINDPHYSITSVITQPDKPVGRKQILTPTPIKQMASELEIEVHTPTKNSDFIDICKKENPEIIIVISYGNILPKSFIDFPKYKTLNIHYSLLPKHRGAIPVQKAIMEGDSNTGVSIQRMKSKLDSGPIIAQKQISIKKEDTTETLKSKLIPIGKDLLINTLPKWTDNQIEPQVQDEGKATYCFEKELDKKEARIKFETDTPEAIERKIRAFIPQPVSWTVVNQNKRLKIFKAQIVEKCINKEAGKYQIEENRIFFATQNPEKAIEPLEVQIEGKNKMLTKDFLQGFRRQ